MQVAAGQLDAHLQRGLRALYVLHGDESLLVQEAADEVRAAARHAGYTEREVFRLAGAHADWGAVRASAGALSLFAERRLLELHLPSGKPGKDGAVLLQQIACDASGDQDTIWMLLLPRLDKATRSSPWFSDLETHGVSVALESIERAALPQWIAQRLARQQQRVASGESGQRALQFFADRTEGNLLAAHQEIQKLALLYGPGELNFEQIEHAVLDVARYDVFKLGEAVLSGQAQRVQRMLEGLQAEGQPEVLVHYTLAEDIRALVRARTALDAGQPLPLVLREQRVWGVRERLFGRVLPRLSASQLADLLRAAHEVDGVVKGLRLPHWPAQPWLALRMLAGRLCRACMMAPTAGR